MSWHSDLQAREHTHVLRSGSRRALRARQYDLQVWLNPRNEDRRPDGWDENQTRRELAEVEAKLLSILD